MQSKDLQAMAKDLRALGADGKVLRKELAAGIRDEVKDVVPVLRAAYLAAPSSRSTPGLRAELAKAVTAEVRLSGPKAGVRIRVLGTKMPAHKGRLPRLAEGDGRWRHPVFGTDAWVTQRPFPLFYEVIAPFKPRVAHAVRGVAVKIERKIAGRASA